MKTVVKTCKLCQVYGPAGPINSSPYNGTSINAPSLFSQYSIDYVGPLRTSNSGCKYILVCVEMFTR